MYCSPSSFDYNSNLVNFLEQAHYFGTAHPLITGDVNLPHNNWEFLVTSQLGLMYSVVNLFLETLMNYFCLGLYHHPPLTSYKVRAGQISIKLLDLILIDNEYAIDCQIQTLCPFKSDHSVIEFTA